MNDDQKQEVHYQIKDNAETTERLKNVLFDKEPELIPGLRAHIFDELLWACKDLLLWDADMIEKDPSGYETSQRFAQLIVERAEGKTP